MKTGSERRDARPSEHPQLPAQVDSGEVEWRSPANQPGTYFFGHTFFERKDGTAIIYTACQNGLHAICGETGRELWWINLRSTGGITPCVDQAAGWVFYQRNVARIIQESPNHNDPVLVTISNEQLPPTPAGPKLVQ